MSNLSLDFSTENFKPLAARMRPETLKQYIGQQHLLGAGKPLPRAIEAGHLHSMILWGPPGTGKTTLAEIIAHYGNADVERISAVTSGVKEIREAIERARQNKHAAVSMVKLPASMPLPLCRVSRLISDGVVIVICWPP